ncbi:MAG: ATP-dependent Clp protease ATP-binding subunit [Planctomycetes bacterium]|nr:ATP-dependent Clp protease ATP-binding subunit [Planctomycetota bacterium]
MREGDSTVVFKYFDLIDGFIRVRALSDEEVARAIARKPAPNRAEYRRRITEVCVVDLDPSVRQSALRACGNDSAAVEDLLYQLCIDVNPRLEIHQVSLPAAAGASTETEPIEGDGDPEIAATLRELQKRVGGLDEKLKRNIIGQDAAITTITRALRKAAAGLSEPNRPVGCFLFVGRTGTGKTALAKQISKHLYEAPQQFVRVDCTEYSLPHEVAKLIGAPPGYVGHGEGGFLTEAIRRTPDAIVLFDEIEKASDKVRNLLLQILDDGILTDSKGKTVRFDRAMVLLTSNVGVEEIERASSRCGFGNTARKSFDARSIKELTTSALKENFRPEFLNRLDEVVVFRDLTIEDAQRIAALQLADVASRIRRTGVKVIFETELDPWIAGRGYSVEYGAREIKRMVRLHIEDPLANLVLDGKVKRSQRVRVAISNGEPNFKVERSSERATVESAG